MENIDNVKLFINSLDSSIRQLQDEISPIIGVPLNELVATNTTNTLEAVKFYNNYLYTLISLLFAYLKTIGVKAEEHPITKELARIKSYMNRLKDVEQRLTKGEQIDNGAKEQAKQYIENTLGPKINGGGAAQPESLSQPAISKNNFKGKHTKFEDKEVAKKETIAKTKTTKEHRKTGKVTKPKRNRK